MKKKFVSFVVCLALLAVTAGLAFAAVATPAMYIGDEWVYNVHYNDGAGLINDINMNVVTKEVTKANDIITADYVPDALRTDQTTGSPLTVQGADTYVNKANMTFGYEYAKILAFGFLPDNATVAFTYPVAPKWPPVAGMTWNYNVHTWDLLGIVNVTLPRQAKVIGQVNVVVPAGTFNCWDIQEVDPANPAVVIYEHWFCEAIGNDVKIVDNGTYKGQETRVLASRTFVPVGSAPTVTAVTPGSVASGNLQASVTVAGTNFVPGAKPSKVTLTVGGKVIKPTNVIVSGHTAILCNFSLKSAPVGAGDITVTNPDKQVATLAGGLTVNAAPTVASSTPSTGAIGASVPVTVAGTGFAAGARVKLTMKGQPDIYATGVVVTPTSITGTLNLTGAIAGSRSVVVVNLDGGSATLAAGFVVTP